MQLEKKDIIIMYEVFLVKIFESLIDYNFKKLLKYVMLF